MSEDPKAQEYISNLDVAIVDYKLKYFRVHARSIGKPDDNYSVKKPIYDRWEMLAQEFNSNLTKKMQTDLGNTFESAAETWAWMMTEQAFVSNAVQGLILSTVFASVVLLLATHNIFVTFYSVMMITCVICSVMGMIQLIGWKLGVAESLATDFFVGFSVDYIVHVAHQYEDSPHHGRANRVRSVY